MLIALILLIIFLIWTYLLQQSIILNYDLRFYQKITLKNNIIKFFKIYTNFGSIKFYLPVLFLLLTFKNKEFIIIYIVLMLINALIIHLIKITIKRPRPDINRLVFEKGYSYPSGHTTSATCFYGFLISCLSFSNPLFIIIALLLILHILLIGYSRIYLGVHYLSDIIGGLLIGSTLLSFYLFMVNIFNLL